MCTDKLGIINIRTVFPNLKVWDKRKYNKDNHIMVT